MLGRGRKIKYQLGVRDDDVTCDVGSSTSNNIYPTTVSRD